jgi:REP element-mobilizing transposase RayT
MLEVQSSDVKLEIGHVLFIDIVGYSKLLITDQSEQLQKLKEIVRGDGGALVFRNMPDHVHFFCAPELDAKPLPIFIGFWKEWSSKRIKRIANMADPVWQEEFFDHVLRSSESYSEKWNYVRNNPVRHGFVTDADDWPWQGEIAELRL